MPEIKPITPEQFAKWNMPSTETTNKPVDTNKYNTVPTFGQLVPEDAGLTPYINQQLLRNANQSGWDMATNAAGRLLQIPFSVVGNVASALDFEDYVNQDQEVGNWLTNAMEGIKSNIREANPIYRRSNEPLDIGDPAWWYENGSSLVESASAFVATGYLTGAGLGLLGKGANSVKWLNQLENSTKAVSGIQWLGNATALNQAESIGIATNVYDKVLREQLESGSSEEDAQKIAAQAASTSINVNRINILLNLTSAKAFIRGSQSTRQLLELPSVRRTLQHAFVQEGLQESSEELVNMIAEKKALAEASGKQYGLTEALKQVFTKEGAEAALLGFIGGAGQTMLTAAKNVLPLNMTEDGKRVSDNYLRTKQYENQQKILESQNNIVQSNGFRNMTDVFETVDKQAQLLDNINQLASEGKDEQAQLAANNLLIYQAQKAFESGTTENLISVYDKLGKLTDEQYEAQDINPEQGRTKAKEAIEFIEELEKDYVDATKYNNTQEVFETAANIVMNRRILNEYDKQLDDKKQELINRLQSKIKIGTFPQPEEYKKDGKPARYEDIDIVNDILAGNWNKKSEEYKNTKQYREAKAIYDKVKAVQEYIDTLEDNYDNLTSPETQEQAKKQKELVQKLQEIEKNNPKKGEEYKEQVKAVTEEAKKELPKKTVEAIEKEVDNKVEQQRITDKSSVAEQPLEKPMTMDEFLDNNESDFFAGLSKETKPQVEEDLDKIFGEQETIDKQLENLQPKEVAVAQAIKPDITEEFNENSIVEESPKDDTTKHVYQDASRLMFLNIPYKQTNDEIVDGEDKVDYKYNINPDNLLPGTKIYVQLAEHPDKDSRVDDEKRPYQTKYMEVRTVDGDVLVGGLTNENHYKISDTEVKYTNSKGTWSRSVPITPTEAKEQLETLNNFRKQVFENGRVETTVEFKGYGQFNNSRGKKAQSTVAKYQPTASIAFVGSEGRLFQGTELHPLFKKGQVLNGDKIASENHIGQTYSILQVRGNQYVAVPVWHKQLAQTEIGNRIIDNITRTVDKFITLNPEQRNVNLLIDHFRTFINWRGDVANKNKYKKVNYKYNLIAKDNAIIISKADGTEIVKGVPYIRLADNMNVKENTKKLILDTVKEALAESYTAVSAKHFDKNGQVKLGDDVWKYHDFVKEITHTNIEGIEVEEGKYAYTVQPYINIQMKDVQVEAKKPVEPTVKPSEQLSAPVEVIDQPKAKDVLERFKKADKRLSPRVIKENENVIQYKLKVIDALDKIQRNRFTKDKLQGWLNDLQKQGVSKQQLEIFKEYAKDGMTKEEIIASISADLSFVVESNISTGGRQENDYGYDALEDTMPDEVVARYRTNKPTSYYSNLTVPGGTNYTENEIRTPQITPSIKGHAKFATSNGIGWFRSDESQQYQETDIQSIIDNLQKSGQLEINCK